MQVELEIQLYFLHHHKMTQDEIKSAIGDIYYEANMLLQTYDEHWQKDPPRSDNWQHCCIIEATLLHVRTLLDFFCPVLANKHVKADDIQASHYSFTARTFPFQNSLREQINKRIFHLTAKRSHPNYREQYWKFEEFVPPILKESRRFFMDLQSDDIPDYPGKTKIKIFIEQTKRF